VWVALRELRSPGDYLGFVAFGRAALDGVLPYSRALETLYRPDLHAAWATWPPAFAPAAAALAIVDRVSRPLGVFLVQTAALGGLAAALTFFAGRVGVGAGVDADAAASRVTAALLLSAPVLLAVAVPYRILLDSLQNTQVNLLVLGLVAVAFGLLGSGRRWVGGFTLGAATSFKAAPLLLLGYLAWRGRWRDLGAAAVGVAAWWIALPALVLGLGGAIGGPGSGAAGGLPGASAGILASYAAWLGHATSGTLLVRGSNQSLLAAILRLAPVGHGAGVALFVAATALLAAITLAAFGRPLRRVGPRREAAELAVMLVAVSLLSPLAWKAHYVSLAPLVLVLAAGVAARTRAGTEEEGESEEEGEAEAAAHANGGRVGAGLLALFALAFVALDLTGRDLVGRGLSAAAERWGAVTWTALALLLAALWKLGSGAGGLREPMSNIDKD
jgi:hypothetical protein